MMTKVTLTEDDVDRALDEEEDEERDRRDFFS